MYPADVVLLDVVGPFHPFDVVEVLILEDLGWMQVLVEDRFADLDVLAHFDVGFPNSFALLLADADVVVVVGTLHPFDVVEVARFDALDAMQVLVDDRLLLLDDFVVCFANKMLLVLADVAAEDVVVHLRSS